MNEQQPTIQWFPGHMKKTERLIEKNLPYVDVVVELIDARVPYSSRNPLLGKLIGNKPRVVLLNKCDMADPNVTAKWLRWFQQQGIPAMAIDCRTGKNIKKFQPFVREVLKETIERRANKGMIGRIVRVMVVGVPNVGKSTFINKLAGSKRAKAEDRPGVTRGKQWVHIENDVDLLDMPGVLWPKFEDPQVGIHLAFTGAIKDDVIDLEYLAMQLLEYLAQHYPERLKERFKLEDTSDMEAYERLEAVGRKRGMLISGGEVNTERAAIVTLDEYRSGKLGCISWEEPSEETA
ncbi:ribosome biogenesis GTPase YlqF [Clostridium facile]|jgi:ribosome biogenesis GTPase A|uniref:Ribosome biogenesis GTPase A n=1 Tax=Clostridium facile TaxID=2763035 RepID=A0ABR7IQH0_9CLOT|nr:ribosome biogenesis GTPase YlqF [Clostridium facile]MBC5787384.1 ribosome biogenesis GTPase YlqF [Clostridium facile]PWM98116.1 MAG: ribosome biogenesis GTPase YlqF [Massilioclostridium sp.]